MNYFEKIIKNVGELFAKPYSLLNEEGKKEADIKRKMKNRTVRKITVPDIYDMP